MEFLKASKEDLKDIIEIENESFHSPFPEDAFLYELNDNPFSRFYVCKMGDEIVGYIIFWITFDSSTLCKIATKVSKRKLGIAGFLLDKTIEMLKNEEVLTMTLEVRKSNEPAISLYKKYGFEYVLTKEKYYDDGEDALYMMKGIY